VEKFPRQSRRRIGARGFFVRAFDFGNVLNTLVLQGAQQAGRDDDGFARVQLTLIFATMSESAFAASVSKMRFALVGNSGCRSIGMPIMPK